LLICVGCPVSDIDLTPAKHGDHRRSIEKGYPMRRLQKEDDATLTACRSPNYCKRKTKRS